MREMRRVTPNSGPCCIRLPDLGSNEGPADYSSGCEKGAAPRRRNPLSQMAPRPGLEPGTCGYQLTAEPVAGRVESTGCLSPQ